MPLPARAAGPEPGSLFVGHPWEGVARLVDRASSIRDLRAHRLELLAAALLRERVLPVPSELAESVREAQLATLTASVLVQRIRDACDGPLLIFKGLEASAHYPASALRPFRDVDVLVLDPESVQRQLERSGFRRVGPLLEGEWQYHLPRLASPDLPFSVEVHRRPKWITGFSGPHVGELLEGAVPSATGIDGVFAPAPAVHAVLLAAHAWAEWPLGCVGDLTDVAAVAVHAGEGRAEDVASRYGVGRMWQSTIAAADALLRARPMPWPLQVWARHLPQVRGQTVLESHLERVLAPFAATSRASALRSALQALVGTVRPGEDENWSEKLFRSRLAARNAFERRSDHAQSLGEERRRR